MKTNLHVEISVELKELVGRAADAQGIPINQLVANILAKFVKRPDLSEIPRKRAGRPRKPFALS